MDQNKLDRIYELAERFGYDIDEKENGKIGVQVFNQTNKVWVEFMEGDEDAVLYFMTH